MVGGLLASTAVAQSFVNFETPHVHPMDITPDGSRLLVANTADNRLEVFRVQEGGSLVWSESVPVGLEPVSVRAFDDRRAWVVNQLSDSVSIVDVETGRVIDTIRTGDEPADVVFAGTPVRAFVSISQENRIAVFDATTLATITPGLPIAGEEPRALATDGVRVHAAIFEAGNRTTIISAEVAASSVNPYPGDQNPPPNDGNAFSPPRRPGQPTPPETSIIVRRDADGRWMDDNARDWSNAVTWDLHGHGLATVDASTLEVTYEVDLLTTNMASAITPEGAVVVVGTEAINEVRYEPNLAGVFIHVEAVVVDPGASGERIRGDLNPHLDYSVGTVAYSDRLQSVGDPRGVVVRPGAAEIWVSGMGSNNIVVCDENLDRLATIPVGIGPTGIVSDAKGDRMYVLNRFDGSVSVVDAVNRVELGRATFFDPTPDFINAGRTFLYDTHLTSGLGQASCASCHVDARMDLLAWDLGDPSGEMKEFNQNCNLNLPVGSCEDWHPMKGPMTTQTLVGLSGLEPFHWRGDREDFGAFDHAFVSILGNDADGTSVEMERMRVFLESIAFPPNPNLELDGSFPPQIAGGDPAAGLEGFMTGNLDLVDCVFCHALPTGGQGVVVSANLLEDTQSLKVPHLRNMYEKTGMERGSQVNPRGFGFGHNGSFATLEEFFERDVFDFPGGEAGRQLRRDVSAFMLCFDSGTHPAIGAQVVRGGVNPDPLGRLETLRAVASTGVGDLVAHGVLDGVRRGFLLGEKLQVISDAVGEIYTFSDLEAASSVETPVVYTLVPNGSGIRIALDRDLDGVFDRDEVLGCADPADPLSVPKKSGCGPDLDGDGIVGPGDLGMLLAGWGPCGPGECRADLDRDGVVGPGDLGMLLAAWG